MKQKADLIGFVISVLLTIVFAITLGITFTCGIDLSLWVMASFAGSIFSVLIGFAVSED